MRQRNKKVRKIRSQEKELFLENQSKLLKISLYRLLMQGLQVICVEQRLFPNRFTDFTPC